MAQTIETRLLSGYQVTLVRSRRRTLSLIVCPDDTVEVRAPRQLSLAEIERMIAVKSAWIRRQQKQNSQRIDIYPVSAEQCPHADQLIRDRIQILQKQYHLHQPRRILIRDLVSRWGSCSTLETISINRRCALLPEPLMDLVIIHEHCHLREMNHSSSFYGKLKYLLPDATMRKSELKKYRLVPREGRRMT